MAVRLDLLLLVGPDDTARPAGFVAAADPDEDLLIELLDRFAAAGALVGARTQGAPEPSNIVQPADAAGAIAEAGTWLLDSPTERAWRDVICWALEECSVLEAALTWITRFDRSGSVDDGAEEWTTSWSDAPTEGDGVDTRWP